MAFVSARPLTASAVRVRIPLRKAFATATGTWTARETWILRLRDTDGRTGLGEVALDPAATSSELDVLAQRVEQVVTAIGAGAAVEALLAGGGFAGADHDASLPAGVCAALEAALIGCGRITLGEGSEMGAVSVVVNAAIGSGTVEDVVNAAQAATAAGFESLKLKAGSGSRSAVADVAELVGAVRTAVGPEVGLRVDANGAWDVPTARAALEALEPFRLEFVEQPLAADGSELRPLADLRRSFPGQIALDESAKDAASAQALLDGGAADVLVLKPARLGGIRASLEIADRAAEAGVDVVVSNLLETGVGLAAGLIVAATIDARASGRRPRFAHGLATADLLATDLLAQSLVPVGGRLAMRDLGALDLDDQAVRAYVLANIGAAW